MPAASNRCSSSARSSRGRVGTIRGAPPRSACGSAPRSPRPRSPRCRGRTPSARSRGRPRRSAAPQRSMVRRRQGAAHDRLIEREPGRVEQPRRARRRPGPPYEWPMSRAHLPDVPNHSRHVLELALERVLVAVAGSPPRPRRSIAMTVKWLSRWGRTASKLQRAEPAPCTSTSGGPLAAHLTGDPDAVRGLDVTDHRASVTARKRLGGRPLLNERLAPQESRAPLSLLPRRVARASAALLSGGRD